MNRRPVGMLGASFASQRSQSLMSLLLQLLACRCAKLGLVDTLVSVMDWDCAHFKVQVCTRIAAVLLPRSECMTRHHC